MFLKQKKRHGFTLIELLVVIAIIAILAAILFPVFAQAKTAAKKTVALAHQKQQSLAITLYSGDSDDQYPRNDDCVALSSLNSKLKQANGGCNGPYYNRVNHYSWQKWLLPYTKSVDLFFHPLHEKEPTNWNSNGEIMNGFAINTAITGSLNTYGGVNQRGAFRDSWLGGNQGGVPSPAQAMILFEFNNPTINFSPIWRDVADDSSPHYRSYPMAIREFWQANMGTVVNKSKCQFSTTGDPARTSGGFIVVGYVDGHAKTIRVEEFLAQTPTAKEIGAPLDADTLCGVSSGVYFPSKNPNLALDYPFWGLKAN